MNVCACVAVAAVFDLSSTCGSERCSATAVPKTCLQRACVASAGAIAGWILVMGDFASFLSNCGCKEWLKPLREDAGADTVMDVMYLTEADLHSIGMKLVSIRKLQHGAACWCGFQYQWASSALTTVSPGQREHIILQQASRKAELEGIGSLNVVITTTDEIDEAVRMSATETKTQLELVESTYGLTGVRIAIRAENAAKRALLACRKVTTKESQSQKALGQVIRSIRDIIVLRTQMDCALETRECFLETLRKAYGGNLDDNDLCKLMVAGGKIVAPLIPHAFLSNNQKQNLSRPQGSRPKRTRDRTRSEAAAKAALETASAEDEEVVLSVAYSTGDALADVAAEGEDNPAADAAGSLGSSSSSSSSCQLRAPPGLETIVPIDPLRR